MTYPYLFQKGYIGKVEIKNRLVMAPMGVGALTGYMGTFSDRSIDYYEGRAIGETGLIITGLSLVRSDIEPWELDGVSQLVTFDSRWKVSNFLQLTERVHDYGARIFVQLTAGFGRVYPGILADRPGAQPIAPSKMPLFWRPRVFAREMTTEEVDELIEAFGHAASMAKESQFDGVELHGHEGYLMDQFTTAVWNKRTDKYGGDLMGRMNFVLSIIRAIRDKAGPDFPIIYRYGLEHKIERGRKVDEGIEIAKILEEYGLDALHVDAGCYDNWYWPHPPIYQPPGCMADMARIVRQHVKIPIITVGRLGYPDLANRIIEKGEADFIALGRPLLADPEFALKAKQGRADEIRPCIGCHECFSRLIRQQTLSCAVNPQCGDEKRLEIAPAPKSKKIMVVGGGPAGMEAARVCAVRGHEVTLYEKGDRLGGLLNIASKPDFKQDISHLLAYQANQLKKLPNVKIVMSTEVSEEIIRVEGPDAIFLAMGSVPIKKIGIEGLEEIPFLTPVDVFEGRIPEGSRALVIGGGSVGCETALYLAQNNWSVTVVENLPEAATDMFEANREMLLKLMTDYGVEVITNATVKKVLPGKVFISGTRGLEEFHMDMLVLAIGRQPIKQLSEVSLDLAEEVYEIGDCQSPGKIKDAIWGAYKRARLV